jgi:hypothetical protein
MSTCGEGSEAPRKQCSKTAEKKRDECVQTRDDGYNECAQTREDRQKKCCTWIPCKWACKAFHWVVSVVCVAWHWVSNIVCVAWHTIVEVVCIAWIVIPVLLCHFIDALASVLGALIALVEAALNWAWSVVGFFVDILLSIPLIGRALSWLLETAKSIVNTLISIPDIGLTLIGIMPEKKLRLAVIALNDARGRPVEPSDLLLIRAVQCAMNIYRQECNIRVIPIRYAQYQTSFDASTEADSSFIFRDDGTAPDRILDVCCEACAFGVDIGSAGADYQLIMSRLTFWGNGRRLLGYGAPIVAFTVRSFRDSAVGCSLGPLTNYVTVEFRDSQHGPGGLTNAQLTPDVRLGRVSTLAHEIAHACNIVWHESGSDNLLSRLTNGERFCRLNRVQKALIRASRHVTYV